MGKMEIQRSFESNKLILHSPFSGEREKGQLTRAELSAKGLA